MSTVTFLVGAIVVMPFGVRSITILPRIDHSDLDDSGVGPSTLIIAFILPAIRRHHLVKGRLDKAFPR